MKSPNQQKLEQSPVHNHTGSRLRQAIHAIRDLKLWRVLLILILLTIVFFIVSIWLNGISPRQYTWLRLIPWNSLATTALGVAFIGYVFEWVVRNETKQEFDEALKTSFEEQEQKLKREIPRAMLITPEIMRDVLAPDMVDNVILTSLGIRLNDTQLAQEAYGSFLSHLLNHEERRSNYRCNVYMRNAQSQDIPAAKAFKYYEGYIDITYETILVKDTFRFTSVATMEDYEGLLKDPTWELRWVAEPTKDYSPDVAFQVDYVYVNGLKLHTRKASADGKQVIIADHLDLQAMQGKPATIHYRYMVKIKKRGHLLMIHVPCPTHNVAVELDYAHTDIGFVNVLDFFASKQKPNVRYIPTRQDCQKIGVEVHDWVFPKGGVVFVWVLRAEKNPAFWRLSPGARRPGRPSSRPHSRITDILPANLLEPDKEDDPTEPSS